MSTHAQMLILVAWTAAGLVLVGWGTLARRVLRAPARTADDLLLSFWLGWASLVLALQVWHLFLRVGPWASALCAAVGALGLLVPGGVPWGSILRRAPRHAGAFVGVLAVAIWLSNHALHGARYGDTGAYFLPTVRWYVEHRIVPGLGNLHGFFALNQSYFLYVAALEVGPFVGRSFHLANGLLVLALFARLGLAMERVLHFRRPARFVDIYWVLMLPGIAVLGVGIFLTSPSPDVAIFALGAVASGELLELLTETRSRTARLRTMALLAVTGLTVKLSFVGYSVALLAVAALTWLRHERPAPERAARTAGVLVLIAVVALGPWVVRNVVMSAFPFFPSAVVVLPFDWRVQTDVEGWLRNSVYMGGVAAIVRSPGWFVGQLLKQRWDAPEVLVPILVGLAAIVVGGGRRLWSRGEAPGPRVPLRLVLPALASLVFCIVMSPVPRYAGATVWLLSANGLLFAFGDRLRPSGAPVRPLAVAAVVVATALTLPTGMDPLWVSLVDFEPMSAVRYEQHRLESGLVVNVPTGSDSCWDAPLPCTGYPNPALRLRREGDLASGFMLDPVLRERFPYEPGAPWVLQPAAPTS